MADPPRAIPPPATQNTLTSGAYAVHDLMFVQDRRAGIVRLRRDSSTEHDALHIEDSGPMAAAFPFNELIPSWNLRVPAGAAYRIDLCVAADATGGWSDWYCVAAVGDAAVVPPAPSPPEQPPGLVRPAAKLHTDYLTCDAPCDRIRVRFAVRAAGGDVPTVDRLVLCVSNTLGDKRVWSRQQAGKRKRADAPLRAGRIPVPFCSQHVQGERLKGNICSPTSVAMLLNYHGKRTTPEQAAAAAYDRRSDLFGNWPFNVQAAYALGGTPGYVRRFGDWDEVELTLARGQPIIASVRDPDGRIANAAYGRTVGHLLVICGIDDRGNVLVNDPAGRDAAAGQLAYERSAFEQAWLRSGGVAYVIERPSAAGVDRP